MAEGIWVSPTRFVRFAEAGQAMRPPIATRARVLGPGGLGGLGQWLPNPDPVLRKLGKSVQVYRDLWADAHVGGCIRRRKAAVKSLQWSIDRARAGERTQALVEAVFARLNLDRIVSEILDASFYGYQPLELRWAYVDGAVVPVDIVGKPAEWFVFDEQNRLRFKARDAGPQGQLLDEKDFVVVRQDASYDNPYGVADLARCFWPTTFKRGGLEFWLRFTERYGSPFMVGKHPRATQQSEADLLLASLEAMVSDAVAVIPDDSSVEIIEAGGKAGSAEVYEKLLHFCRSEVSIALLGQNQTTEADTTNASAQAGALVTEDIRNADKAMVEAALNQVIGWIVERNTDDEAPRFSMREPEDVDKERAERDQILASIASGPYFTKEYWKHRFHFRDEDLADRPVSTAGPAPFGVMSGAAAFAEFGAAGAMRPAPDQAALDAAIEAIAPSALQAQSENLLRPALAAIQAGKNETEVLGLLAEAYPDMQDDDLIQTLRRLFFAADAWGRLSLQSER